MFRLKSELRASFHPRHLTRDETPGRARRGGVTDGVRCPRAGGGMARPAGTPFNVRLTPACASPFEWTPPPSPCICHNLHRGSLTRDFTCRKSRMLSADTVLGIQKGGLPGNPPSHPAQGRLGRKITRLNDLRSDNHLHPHCPVSPFQPGVPETPGDVPPFVIN